MIIPNRGDNTIVMDLVESVSVRQRLARLAQKIRFEDLSTQVVHSAKRLILDSVACIVPGLSSRPAAAARAMADRLGGACEATIIGTDRKTSPALAAFTNGTALRYFDMNASYGGRDPGKMSEIVPVVLALGESERRSGRALIAALVAGCEVQGRLCEFAGAPSMKLRGWHHTCNLQFGAVVAAAHLLTDDPNLLAEALSISATHQNTLAQIQHGHISMIKSTADGWVAKGGIEAALLAVNGLTGPDDIFEGKAGWAASVAGAIDYDGLLAPLNGTYRITDARFKALAIVGPAQAAAQAALDLYEKFPAIAGQVDRIDVLLPEHVISNPANDSTKRFPNNKETADHSVYYGIAVSLIDGECGEGQYSDAKINSPIVRALIEKIFLEADPEFSSARSHGGGVRVLLHDGTVHEQRYSSAPGHPKNPLSDEQLAGKYDRQMKALYARDRSEAIKAAIFDLDNVREVSGLTKLLARP